MPELKLDYIKFFDYRAFFNGNEQEYLIELGGNNLLVYGENGSGKSSLFRGLRDFVLRSDFITHNQTPRESEGYIEIGFSDGTNERLEESGGKPTKPEVLNTAKLNSFLSYKELLKTHLFEGTDEINFFDLLVDGILKHHQLESRGNLNTAWQAVKALSVQAEEEKVKKSLADEEISSDEADELIEKIPDEIDEQIKNFNEEVEQLITEVNQELSKFLGYFDPDLEVVLQINPIEKEKYNDAEIRLEVKLFGQKIEAHHDFLNEARLSALAISIYLAALKLNPTADSVKLIFLDDVFIGLDTSNRIPLLDILSNEFEDWQILITTYDRHWFEVAKKHLKSNWKEIEMYAGRKGTLTFEVPVIIQESNDYLTRAKKYFEAKDYPACSNYLRKELERLIKLRLPEEYVRNFESKPKMLSEMWMLCVDRYSKLHVPVDAEVKKMFELTRLVLLNPFSHDSIHHPIYKKELENAFELINKVKAHPIVNQIVILTKGSKLEFRHPKENYTFKFELRQDWRLDIRDGIRSVDYPKCKIAYWEFEGKPFWDFKKGTSLTSVEQSKVQERDDKLNKIIDNLSKVSSISITRSMILKHTRVENHWTLKSYFDKIDESDNAFIEFIKEVWTNVKNQFK
ncbi:MAG: hypothetical protein VYB44_15180 [Bacteroidota bacterium]|nr:hypothetical protein [Bacteroidota bacterium]